MMHCPEQSHRMPLIQVFSQGETDFRMCPACGIVFRKEFPGPAELEEIYRQAYSEARIRGGETDQESGTFASKAYARYLAARVARRGQRVLDVGAGTGELVALLRRSGLDADGVEYSRAARDYCAQNRGIALSEDFARLSPGSYDLITMIEVIEHVTDLRATLSGARSLLKPGGRLFVTTPNRRNIRALIEKGHWREARKKFHLFLFDRASLERHLSLGGYARVENVAFAPVTKPGAMYWLAGRAMQAASMPGSLCVIAHRD
jgi:SAM-dependent methyltransferase